MKKKAVKKITKSSKKIVKKAPKNKKKVVKKIKKDISPVFSAGVPAQPVVQPTPTTEKQPKVA